MNTKTTYWSGTGKYQQAQEKLWEELVPKSGEAPTALGELVRSAGRLYYEFCNNGNCNAADGIYETEQHTCNGCGGDGVKTAYAAGGGDVEEIMCGECYGDGAFEEESLSEYVMVVFFEDLLIKLESVPHIEPYVQPVRELICHTTKHHNYKYTQAEYAVYNHLTDAVIEYVMKELGRDLAITNPTTNN